MADRIVNTVDTLEAFRTTFNSTASDVGDIADLDVAPFAGSPTDLVEGINSKAHYTGQTDIVTVGTITTGTWEATDVGVAHGGTGASTILGAQQNLDLEPGVDIQAYDAELAALASTTSAADALPYFTGVGTATTTTLTAFGRSIIDDVDEATFKATVNLEPGVDVQAYDAGLADIAALAVTDGNFIVGDGANWIVESGATARTSLGVAIGSDVQAYDAQLDDIAALAVTDGNFIVGDGANWIVESGDTAIASLGVTATGTELNTIDGDTAATATTVVGTDTVVYNDAGVMKQVTIDEIDTYLSGTTQTLTNKTLTSPVLNTGVSGTAVLDDDTFGTASATTLATSESIKAYVDTSVGSGSVTWRIETANYTAVSGDGVMVDTDTLAITITLPASPSLGNFVRVLDATGNASGNNITVARNGENIAGSAADLTISTDRAAIGLVYVNVTEGWVLMEN